MQDKQVLGMLEKYSKLSEVKALQNQASEIITRLSIKDKDFILEKIIGGLQSTDNQIKQNYALLLYQLLTNFKEIDKRQLLDLIQEKLSKKKSLGKTEYKHFQLSKYMIYSFIDVDKLLTYILEDRKTEDSEFLAYILIKQIKQQNVKQIASAIKNETKQMTPRLFSIMVALQQQAQQGQFQWDKLLQESVFDRNKLSQLINQALDNFPKYQLFYKYLMIYLERFSNLQESQEIFQEFWQYIQNFEHKKSLYLTLSLLRQFLKSTNLSIELIKQQQLIELWYRSFGSSNAQIKKLSHQIEKELSKKTLSFEDICYLRCIYGYRLSPKNAIAQQYLNFDNEQSLKFLKLFRKQINSQTDPIKKLYYLNEIYVFAICNFNNLKEQQYAKIIYFIYEKGCTNFEQIYQSLDQESQDAYTFEEVKKKFEDQCQSFYFSLLGKAASDLEYFTKLVKSIIEQCSKVEQDKFEQIQQVYDNLTTDNQTLKHLCDCVVAFSVIHYDEGLSIIDELENVCKEISGSEPKLKKKAKTNENKAKTVLTEIFIQLLTKSPQYLREAVNECFKTIEFGNESLDILLDVLNKNDMDYINEMAQQEGSEIDEQDDEEEEIEGEEI